MRKVNTEKKILTTNQDARTPAENNVVGALPKMPEQPKKPEMMVGTVHTQWVRCGRDGCRCAQGQLHGPYIYRFYREGGRLRKQYVKRADVPAVTAACNARKAKVESQRLTMRAIREIVKQNRARWRTMEATMKRMMRGEL